MRYRRRCASARTSTSPAFLRTRRCLDTAGWLTPRRSTSSPTGRSPSRSRSRIASRRGSARTWSTARAAMRTSIPIELYARQVIKRTAGRRQDAAPRSAHRFLHERPDPALVGGRQLRQREGGRPHGAFVEVRLVAEAERRVPGFELLRALEEADDLAVLGIRGHPVPGSRRDRRRAGFDDRMEPLSHGAIRFRHRGALREHVAFPVCLARARATARGRLQLLGALLHRGSFLVRESLGRLAARGGALGGLLRGLLCAHRSLPYLLASKLFPARLAAALGRPSRVGSHTGARVCEQRAIRPLSRPSLRKPRPRRTARHAS